jgi:hypothetical protein
MRPLENLKKNAETTSKKIYIYDYWIAEVFENLHLDFEILRSET